MWEGPVLLNRWEIFVETLSQAWGGLAGCGACQDGVEGCCSLRAQGNPWRPWGGACAQVLPPPGFTVAMAAAGLSRPQLFHPCKYVQKKSQPKLADRINGNERRNNPGCSLLGAVRQTPPQDCLAGGGGRIPSGECWEDAGIPPHHGLP